MTTEDIGETLPEGRKESNLGAANLCRGVARAAAAARLALMEELTQKKCVPCEGGVPKLTPEQVQALAPQVPMWRVVDDRQLQRRFEFDDFVAAMAFVNRLADLAEAEAHHPDFFVQYSLVDVSLWTHAIGGLSENDFILAAKIDQLPT